MLVRVWDKIKDWYHGKFRLFESDPDSDIVIVGGDFDKHWTARLAKRLVDFWLAHWQ